MAAFRSRRLRSAEWRTAAVIAFAIAGALAVACGGGSNPSDPSPDGGAPNGNGDRPGGGNEADAATDETPGEEPDDTDPGGQLPDDDTGPPLSGYDGYLLAPTAACRPTGNVCDATTDPGIFATFRKDFFYPKSRYDEPVPDPVNGGRVHVVTVAKVTGTLERLELGGVDAEQLEPQEKIDWYNVYPRNIVAGQPVWISFHTRDTAYDAANPPPVRVKVVTDAGDAVDGTFPVRRPTVPFTYVTTNKTRDKLLVWLQNRDTDARTLKRLLVNGRDVTATACIPKTRIARFETAFIEVPLCTPLKAGDPWSVVAEFNDAPTSTAGGRAITTHFPIISWPSSADCPFPQGNAANFRTVLDAKFDGVMQAYSRSACPVDADTFIRESLIPNNFWVMMGRPSQANANGSTTPIRYTEEDNVLAIQIGDETDDKDLGDKNNPESGPKGNARATRRLWRVAPQLATYVGGSRHRWTGTFSGVADIQGMDFYVSNCAPWITHFSKYPPLRGSYDYLYATRENHMPLPTWTYSLLYGNKTNLDISNPIRIKLNRQPEPHELRVQAYSVMAAGSKGLMWFQMILREINESPPRNRNTWLEATKINREYRGVRKYLREGDLTGAARVEGANDILVDAIRSKDAIVVPVINASTTEGPTPISCQTSDPHWKMRDVTFNLTVAVPADMPVFEIFEVVDGKTVPVQATVTGRRVVFQNVRLGTNPVTKLFVLAAKDEVRKVVDAGLAE